MAPRVRPLLASVAVAILSTGCGSDNDAPSTSPAPTPPPALHGAVPPNHVARPQFTLRDTSGRRYDFRAETAGQVTLLYAGYTHCPDECPTTMADVATALRKLPRSLAGRVKVVFMSVDPWRDSRRVIRRWLDGFRPPTPYVGLTGTRSELARVERRLGMPVAERHAAPPSFGSGAYEVSHFDGLLTYGRNDRLLTIYPSTAKASAIAADLRKLLEA